MPSQDLSVHLLVPLEIRVGDRPLTLTGRQRAPAAAPARIRSLITEIRRSIGPAAAGAVVTRSPGYVIQIDPALLDLTQFEQLFGSATRAAAVRDWTQAMECFDRP